MPGSPALSVPPSEPQKAPCHCRGQVRGVCHLGWWPLGLPQPHARLGNARGWGNTCPGWLLVTPIPAPQQCTRLGAVPGHLSWSTTWRKGHGDSPKPSCGVSVGRQQGGSPGPLYGSEGGELPLHCWAALVHSQAEVREARELLPHAAPAVTRLSCN